MFFKEKDAGHKNIKSYLKSNTFQRLFIGIITVILAFIIVQNGAAPKKYKLDLGQSSPYDIFAPREIINTIKTKEKEDTAAKEVRPVMQEISNAFAEVFQKADDFTTLIETARKDVEKNLKAQGITGKSANYKKVLASEQAVAAAKLGEAIKKQGVPLSDEQVSYLISKAGDDDIANFKKVTKELISRIMMEDITDDTLTNKIVAVQNDFQKQSLNQNLINIGELLVKAILEPNRTVNAELTEAKRKEARNDPRNTEKILKGTRIISIGEKVTADKLKILEDLNFLETKSRFDFVFAGGILAVLLLLAYFLIIYMRHFCRKILHSRNSVVILSIIVLLTLLIARGVYEYSPLAIPFCIAAMSISILLDLKLALVVNVVLAVAVSFIIKGDIRFTYIVLALISGSFSAFFVSNANQRSKLSMAGITTGIINVLIIVCIGIINKSDVQSIFWDCVVVFLNGIVSIILTIGMLPFWESTFNVITPLKLLELANPNQPLIKRLLMEAPGTYHHSLMVGNLAEVAADAVGGNALLARIGAYFHDVGKLKRPYFFKENQMADNPHDRMTANLSTLVITSHTTDGVELAEKYKIPVAIRDIILQHHGTTLVAYFYHKAKKGEKGETVKQENFRYEGPKPMTREAAVVMLADSVEAAVRSMIDRTEGKIEGLVRKIIKDKLDDGQLDLCNLTLKDLDNIAKAFLRVLSGFFHAREEYPEVKVKAREIEDAEKDTAEKTEDVKEVVQQENG